MTSSARDRAVMRPTAAISWYAATIRSLSAVAEKDLQFDKVGFRVQPIQSRARADKGLLAHALECQVVRLHLGPSRYDDCVGSL